MLFKCLWAVVNPNTVTVLSFQQTGNAPSVWFLKKDYVVYYLKLHYHMILKKTDYSHLAPCCKITALIVKVISE